MFLVIAMFCLPLYYLYGSNVGLSEWKSFPIMRFTMGNLGGANVVCKHSSLSHGFIKLQCSPNTQMDVRQAVFGVISNDFDSLDHCHQSSVDVELKLYGYANCTTLLDQKELV